MLVKLEHEGAHSPTYGSDGAAGLDLYCADDFVIQAFDQQLISVGFSCAIPVGYVGLVRSRSSLAVRGLHVGAGVIDSDYRGIVKVLLRNESNACKELKSGERIAQLLLIPCPQQPIVEVDELPKTVRDTGGFGSTGA